MREAAPPAPARASVGVPPAAPASLHQRLTAAGRRLGAREAAHREALDAARRHCVALHGRVAAALDAFHAEAAAAGAPHLRLELGAPRLDEKHVRAFEFELRRGRHVGLVVVKARGELTLVGPFRDGRQEGPCRSLPWDDAAALDDALGGFLERLVEEAATP